MVRIGILTYEDKAMGSGRLPLWPKVLFTAFMAVLVPVYWMDYGPTNFLYFCDVALFFTLAALWLESPLLASAPLVGIFLPQLAWQVDFLSGANLLKMTSYMFKAEIPLFTRALSFFHFWLPLFLLWMVWRLRYDRRAFYLWTPLAIVLLVICYYWMPPPGPREDPNTPVNINYVYGLNDKQSQEMMHPDAWFAMLLVGLPVFVYLPTHLLLAWLFPMSRTNR